MTSFQDLARVALIGVGATAIVDVWGMFLKRLGVQPPNFAFVGRWVGHGRHGRFAHAAIAKAPPIPGELALGWFVHYAVGVAFAGVLVGIAGMDWARSPSLWPALAVGVGTVAAPFLLMQPAMGAGFAAANTPNPRQSRLRSVATHAVFGLGLYASAALMAWMAR